MKTVENKPTLNYENDVMIRAETFEEMGLKKNLIQGIYNYGFEKPSVIQQKGIVPLIQSLFSFGNQK